VAYVSTVNERQSHTAVPERSGNAHRPEPGSNPSNLRVTVVATKYRGTIAALRTAGRLAADLAARVALVKTQVVPFALPLDEPPVSIAFLHRQLHNLVCKAGIQAEEISIQVCLCRDRKETLRKILPLHCLVVVGGREPWWSRSERTLERYLTHLGHEVVFVNQDARAGLESRSDSGSGSPFQSCWTRSMQ